MSAHINYIKSLLGVSAILSFYGIASIGVWFLGSQFGLSVTMEIVLIAFLLATLPFVMLFAYMRRKREAKAQLAEAAAPPPQLTDSAKRPAQQPVAPIGTYTDVTNGAEEAAQWLKSTRLGSTSKSDNALYALPWFLVTGPPASGKTSFVLSSGFNFHALPSQQGSDLQMIRPTRNCEWRVTDSAVLLDTTGRYQTESSARDEWSALIETIKKYRGARPLDGLLLAVSAEQMTRLKDAEIEQQAKLLRTRVDELLQRTKARFPVYLVLTHIDAVEGFRDFFASFGREERAQVWGATIPLQQAANAHALFDTEFDHLYDTLMHRRLVRLNAQLPPGQSMRIFNFPPRLGAVRGKLGLFASTLFRPTPFSESPLLRGFYFTANLNNSRRGNNTDAGGGAPAASLDQNASDEARLLGEGFFADRFFKEVLLGDKDIAASFQAQKRRPHYLRNALIGLAAALLLFIAAGAVVSFFKNKRLIAEAVDRGTTVIRIRNNDRGKDPTRKPDAESRLEIEAVEDLRSTLAKLDEHEREGPPLSLRFGFYTGSELSEKLHPIYFESIGERFFENTIKALEDDLRKFVATTAVAPSTQQNAAAVSDVDAAEETLSRHYDLLKAYLMLGDPSKVEPTFLADQLDDYWTRFAPPDQKSAALLQLEFYARQVRRDYAPHNKPNDLLVSQAKKKLERYPTANRYYKQITTDINAKAASVNLDTILQGSSPGVLSSTHTVPGSFTIEGYRKYMITALASANEAMGEDEWVLEGARSDDAKSESVDIEKLKSMYFRDYAKQWREFLKNTSVTEYKNRNDASDALQSISETDSPMQRVLETVVRNTNISAEQESTGFVGWVKSFFGGKNDEGAAVPTNEVEKDFLPLFQFAPVKSTKETTPISEYLGVIALAQKSVASSSDQSAQTAKALLTSKDETELQKNEQKIAKLLDGFKTPAAIDTAALLKQPLRNLRALVYSDVYEQIKINWRDQIYQKAKAIESGFPFTEGGESSVADLARYLNPSNGQLTTFFNSQLAPSFEDAQGQWKLKETGAFKFSDEFVGYLNNARRLREALFSPAGALEVNYEMTLQPTPNADVVMQIDGQTIEARGTPSSMKLTWPARTGSATSATIKVIPTGGPITDAPPQQSYSGAWGLFKMFAAGAPTKTPDGQFALTWNVGAVPVSATLRPDSANNPFQGNLFKTLCAPQGLQK
ncbi:MAG: type VI secretion system membrane subunit TssM [Pyrinomonadaceae bacterium]